MGKTSAERKAEQRRRLKESGKYEEFRKAETNRQKVIRNERKQNMTVEEKVIKRWKKREDMRKYREKCHIKQQLSSSIKSTSPSKIFNSESIYRKELAKAKSSLPKSPTKRKSIIENIYKLFSAASIAQNKEKSFTATSEVCMCDVCKDNKRIFDPVSYRTPKILESSMI